MFTIVFKRRDFKDREICSVELSEDEMRALLLELLMLCKISPNEARQILTSK